MWSDNENKTDFLNFTAIANTIAEIITQTEGRPISIGVHGAWGAGKSSMIKLARTSIETKIAVEGQKIKFVESNAWLCLGYDDALTTFMKVMALRLSDEANTKKTGRDKAVRFSSESDGCA